MSITEILFKLPYYLCILFGMYEGNCVLVKKWEGLIQMNIIFWQKHSPPHFAPKSRCVQLLVLVHQIFVPILHSSEKTQRGADSQRLLHPQWYCFLQHTYNLCYRM